MHSKAFEFELSSQCTMKSRETFCSKGTPAGIFSSVIHQLWYHESRKLTTWLQFSSCFTDLLESSAVTSTVEYSVFKSLPYLKSTSDGPDLSALTSEHRFESLPLHGSPMTSGVVMTKTPFPRKNSSSMEEDEEEEDFRDVFSPPPPIPKSKANSSRSNGITSARSLDHPESSDKDQPPIEIKKVVSNAVPVVNKMSQQIYADHQSQAPAKGRFLILIKMMTFDI